MRNVLTPEKALIFRIIHRDNLAWIVKNGLHCASSNILDPQYERIGDQELIHKRTRKFIDIPPGGTLADYVAFYFTPCSPMLLNIRTGFRGIRQRSNEEILILVSSLSRVRKAGLQYLFTDRHAYLKAAEFWSDLGMLVRINWSILQERDFRKDPDEPDKFERYQAEALIHRWMPIDALLGVACCSAPVASDVKRALDRLGSTLRVVARPEWYF
jgi:hypothetical protein